MFTLLKKVKSAFKSHNNNNNNNKQPENNANTDLTEERKSVYERLAKTGFRFKTEHLPENENNSLEDFLKQETSKKAADREISNRIKAIEKGFEKKMLKPSIQKTGDYEEHTAGWFFETDMIYEAIACGRNPEKDGKKLAGLIRKGKYIYKDEEIARLLAPYQKNMKPERKLEIMLGMQELDYLGSLRSAINALPKKDKAEKKQSQKPAAGYQNQKKDAELYTLLEERILTPAEKIETAAEAITRTKENSDAEKISIKTEIAETTATETKGIETAITAAYAGKSRAETAAGATADRITGATTNVATYAGESREEYKTAGKERQAEKNAYKPAIQARASHDDYERKNTRGIDDILKPEIPQKPFSGESDIEKREKNGEKTWKQDDQFRTGYPSRNNPEENNNNEESQAYKNKDNNGNGSYENKTPDMIGSEGSEKFKKEQEITETTEEEKIQEEKNPAENVKKASATTSILLQQNQENKRAVEARKWYSLDGKTLTIIGGAAIALGVASYMLLNSTADDASRELAEHADKMMQGQYNVFQQAVEYGRLRLSEITQAVKDLSTVKENGYMSKMVQELAQQLNNGVKISFSTLKTIVAEVAEYNGFMTPDAYSKYAAEHGLGMFAKIPGNPNLVYENQVIDLAPVASDAIAKVHSHIGELSDIIAETQSELQNIKAVMAEKTASLADALKLTAPGFAAMLAGGILALKGKKERKDDDGGDNSTKNRHVEKDDYSKDTSVFLGSDGKSKPGESGEYDSQTDEEDNGICVLLREIGNISEAYIAGNRRKTALSQRYADNLEAFAYSVFDNKGSTSLTAKQAAEMAGCSVSTVYRMAKKLKTIADNENMFRFARLAESHVNTNSMKKSMEERVQREYNNVVPITAGRTTQEPYAESATQVTAASSEKEYHNAA